MRRRKIILIGCLILSALAYAETRTAYVLVPGDLEVEDVKVTGIIKIGNTESQIYYRQQLDNDGNVIYEKVLDEEGKETGIEKPAIVKQGVEIKETDDYPEYGDTKYIEMSADGLEGSDEVKFMLGYESGEEGGLTRYTIIASPDIGDYHDEIQAGVTAETDYMKGLEIMEFGNIAGYDNYETFPGRELISDATIYSGFVVGDQKMDETGEPSNIVDIYYAKADPGEKPINVVDGGASLNPGTGQDNEFQLWSLRVVSNVPDEDGKYTYLTETGEETKNSEEAEKVLLYSNHTSATDETPLYSDFSEFSPSEKPTEGVFYSEGESYEASDGKSYPYGIYENFVFDVSVRFQGDKVPKLDEKGNIVYDKNNKMVMVSPSVIINGEDVLDGGGKQFYWSFNGTSDVTLEYLGGQILFNFEGENIVIIPEDGQDVPEPIAQKIYVMEDAGKFMEGNATMTSKYEDTTKYRTSNIKMRVMKKSESNDKNYEIENIEVKSIK